MIIANSALRAFLAIYHLTSKTRSWNNCKIYWITQLILIAVIRWIVILNWGLIKIPVA